MESWVTISGHAATADTTQWPEVCSSWSLGVWSQEYFKLVTS